MLALYVAAMGLSGSILVFRDELETLMYPKLRGTSEFPHPWADLPTVAAKIRDAYPGSRLDALYLPTARLHTMLAYVSGKQFLYVFANPVTGEVLGEIKPNSSWLEVVANFHLRLWGGKAGLIANGIGAILLLSLCVTGLLTWLRARSSLHGRIGIWTLGMIFCWALSGTYFIFPTEFTAAVNRISPVTSEAPPVFQLPLASAGPRPTLRELIAKASAMEPRSIFTGVSFPATEKSTWMIFMARNGDPRAMDYLYFDQSTGTYLATWRRGDDRSAGDKLISAFAPLHFGSRWGFAMKFLWSAAGCAMPLLAITGLLLFWKRVQRVTRTTLE